MPTSCPICQKGEIVQETYPVEFDYQTTKITVDHTQEYCNACGSLVQPLSIIELNVRRKQDAIRTQGASVGGDVDLIKLAVQDAFDSNAYTLPPRGQHTIVGEIPRKHGISATSTDIPATEGEKESFLVFSNSSAPNLADGVGAIQNIAKSLSHAGMPEVAAKLTDALKFVSNRGSNKPSIDELSLELLPAYGMVMTEDFNVFGATNDGPYVLKEDVLRMIRAHSGAKIEQPFDPSISHRASEI